MTNHEYLGKTKCYEYVCKHFDYSIISKFRNMFYGSDCGVEWLEFCVAVPASFEIRIIRVIFDHTDNLVRVREIDFDTHEILSEEVVSFHLSEEITKKQRRYLKKTKCYKCVCEYLNYSDIPKMKECSYKFYDGIEWLEFCVSGSSPDDCKIVKVTFNNPFNLLRVCERDFDTGEILRDEVVSCQLHENLKSLV